MTIFISNFRAGFATNSSSSHSVVLLPEDQIGMHTDEGDIDGQFGTGDFQIVSEKGKMLYLAAALFSESFDDEQKQQFKDYFGPHVHDLESKMEGGYNLYVDHQSALSRPPRFSTMFAKYLTNIFMSPRVVVLGGGDDGSRYLEDLQRDSREPLLDDLKSGYKVRIKDDGDNLILFNKRTGNKMRISENPAPYVKSVTPELVDLKITNYCEAGCEFCYQASTPKGKHAPLADIKRIVDQLRAMNVFEIAIGGGEPTEHPYFTQILEYIGDGADYRDDGIKPNFTTYTNKWLDDSEIVRAVQRNVGGIGVSCSSAADLELAYEIKAKVTSQWNQRPEVMAQHVLGSVPLHQTAEFLDAAFKAKMPVLLLGFKEVGFGRDFQRHDVGDVAMFLKMAVQKAGKGVKLSVDTALVDQYPDLCKALGVPEALVTSPEGKFSCYIDAVTGKMGPSSYVSPKTMDVLPKTVDGIKAAYAAY